MPGRSSRAAAALAGALLVVPLAACTGGPAAPAGPTSGAGSATAAPVSLPGVDPGLDPAGRAACDALLAGLPATLAGQPRDDRPTEPGTASYGDPAIAVRCGVGVPAGFDPTAVPGPDQPAPCVQVSRVGWYVAPEQVAGGSDAVLTAVTYAPRVAVLVPQEYLPEGSAAALAELAEPIRASLSRSLRCG